MALTLAPPKVRKISDPEFRVPGVLGTQYLLIMYCNSEANPLRGTCRARQDISVMDSIDKGDQNACTAIDNHNESSSDSDNYCALRNR